MRAVIPVDHAPCVGLSDIARHGKCIGGQVSASSGINGPADYSSGERVQNDAAEQFSFPRGKFRSDRHPQLVRSRAGEVPPDQVSVHALPAVRSARFGVDRVDHVRQQRVTDQARGRRPSLPVVEPRR